MSPQATAAKKAGIAVGIGVLLMLVPGINVLVLIGVMLPLWLVSDLGVPGLGYALNGFFVPSMLGWCLAAIAVWSACFAWFFGRARHAAARDSRGA